MKKIEAIAATYAAAIVSRGSRVCALEEDPVMFAANLGEVADGRIRGIRYESEPVPRIRWRTGASGCRRRRRDHFNGRPILEIAPTKCVNTVAVRSAECRAAPFHLQRVDDRVNLSERMVCVE